MWGADTTELAATCFGLELARRLAVDYVHLKGGSMTVMTANARREKGIALIHAIYDICLICV